MRHWRNLHGGLRCWWLRHGRNLRGMLRCWWCRFGVAHGHTDSGGGLISGLSCLSAIIASKGVHDIDVVVKGGIGEGGIDNRSR